MSKVGELLNKVNESAGEVVKMIASMYRNLQCNVQEVEVEFVTSKFNDMKKCFWNAQRLQNATPGSKYVLGFVILYGTPIEHAWVKTADGKYVDSTIDKSERHISAYYSLIEVEADDMKSLIKSLGGGEVDLANLNRYYGRRS